MADDSRTYLDQLRAHCDEQRHIHDLERTAAAMARQVKCTKPLDQQIIELMRTLPPPLRDRPWSMAELVQRLTGKYRDRPHPQNVGEALRRQGWRKERRYDQGFEGRRIWLPPC